MHLSIVVGLFSSSQVLLVRGEESEAMSIGHSLNVDFLKLKTLLYLYFM